MREMRGITLVALVITIIILLILAGVTLNLTLGENGLLKRAEFAKEEYKNSQNKEQNKLDELYSSIMIATGEDSKITISMEDLRALIKKEVEESQSKMCSPIFLTEARLPYTDTNKRTAGNYKASSNLYTKSNSEKMENYLKYEENNGWIVLKDGWYWISTYMNHEEYGSNLVRCYMRILVNSVSVGNTWGDKYMRKW